MLISILKETADGFHFSIYMLAHVLVTDHAALYLLILTVPRVWINHNLRDEEFVNGGVLFEAQRKRNGGFQICWIELYGSAN